MGPATPADPCSDRIGVQPGSIPAAGLVVTLTRTGSGSCTQRSATNRGAGGLFVQGATPAVINPARGQGPAGLERDDLFTVVHDQCSRHALYRRGAAGRPPTSRRETFGRAYGAFSRNYLCSFCVFFVFFVRYLFLSMLFFFLDFFLVTYFIV